MVAEQSFSLAMATQEEVADLRSELDRLRREVEGQMTAEHGAREELSRELWAEVTENFLRIPNQDEFYEYITSMEKRFEENQASVQIQLAQLMDTVNAAAAAATSPGQAFVASVPPGTVHKMHLTQRKGFDGLATYGGGAQ